MCETRSPVCFVPRPSTSTSSAAMPARKGKTGKTTGTSTPSTQTQSSALSETSTYFPFARYTSIVGVHTSLLAFCALILPGTSLSSLAPWGDSTAGEHKSSRDIAELLTENPVRTVGWMCAGALLVQSWWASWLRKWCMEGRPRKSGKVDPLHKHSESNEWKRQRIVVRLRPSWRMLSD